MRASGSVRVSSGRAAISSGSASAVTAARRVAASLSCHFGLKMIRESFTSYQTIEDADAGQIFADHHAEIREHEHEQRARHAVFPPAAPVEHVVTQRFEVCHTRAMQPH